MKSQVFPEEAAVKAARRNISEYIAHRYSGKDHDEAFALSSIETPSRLPQPDVGQQNEAKQ